MQEMMFKTLGVMIDCSRNAVMKVSELKKFICLMARMGYNRLMLYTEDTYEVDGECFFGYTRGKYSQSELKELDDFAFENGIEMIPCIQTLAHFTSLVRWQQYKAINDMDDILIVGEERTYNLIENMISSLRKCFRADKIHIGMDEAHMLGRGKYLDKNGLVDKNKILLSHLKKVCEITEKYNFKPMMWSDMFYRIASGGEYYNCDANFDDSIKSSIPEGLSLVFWDYYHIDKKVYDSMIKGHSQLSDKLLFAGGAWKWGSFTPNNELSVETTKTAFSSCIENGIEDVFITLWGDDGAEASVYSVLPTLVTAACVARGITDIKAYFYELLGCKYDDFMLLDLPDKEDGYSIDYVINPCKYQLYNDCFMGIYDCGVYEGDGAKYGELAKKISDVGEKAGEYEYIFDTLSKLCSVLEIKSEIGVRTRLAYKKNDKDTLRKIINDYAIMILRTEQLYELFKNQWYIENKPNGFEIHDIRLGGLIMRMKNCRNRLVSFCNGDVNSIAELEEERLKTIEKKELVYKWREIVSGGVI